MLSRLSICFKSCNKLLIAVGINETAFYAIRKNIIIESQYIKHNIDEQISLGLRFIEKYKKYDILFILDNDVVLRHETIPILPSISNAQHIEDFISEHFHDDDIVAHSVYESNDIDNCSIVLASTPNTFPSKVFIIYVLQKYLNLIGIYFLSLEFIPIINYLIKTILPEYASKITDDTYNKALSDSIYTNKIFQILVCITKLNGIKIISKHGDNIVSVQNKDFPNDKSLEYIQGMIEQEINDCILSHKQCIASKQLRIQLIFILHEQMWRLISKSLFPVSEVLFYTRKTISNIKNIVVEGKDIDEEHHSKYVDDLIALLCIEQPSYLGSNTLINAATKLRWIDKVISRPVIAILATILILIGILQMSILYNVRINQKLNAQYYDIVSKYDYIQQNQKISNIINLLDIYDIQQIVKAHKNIPYHILDTVISSATSNNIALSKISWDYSNIHTNHILAVDAKYFNTDATITNAFEKIINFTNDISTLSNTNVSYERVEEDIISVNKATALSAKILITDR